MWLEIFTKYSDPKRNYHTIEHLEAMVVELKEVKTKIEDWDTVIFAVFYHDIIYKASSNSNEEDSAKIAMQRLSEIKYPAERIAKCAQLIIATKQHLFSVDADLSILGKSADTYQSYAEKIREEYSLYPDFMYNSGRKKALQHFLQMDNIYKTDYFIHKYEMQARINIENELMAIQ
jgi:predicted metal-dependent HD superfamily phosphohydrolase